MTHERYEENVGPYGLGALSDLELLVDHPALALLPDRAITQTDPIEPLARR